MSLAVRPQVIPDGRISQGFASAAPTPAPLPPAQGRLTNGIDASSVVTSVVAEFAATSDLRVAGFAIESGVAVHVAGGGATSGTAVARCVVTRMTTWDGGVVALPVIGRDGPVAVLTAADEGYDQGVSELLHELGQAVLDGIEPPEPTKPETLSAAIDRNVAPVFNSAAVAFMVVDLEGRVVYANPTVEQVTGTPAKALVGRSAWDPKVLAPAAPAAPEPPVTPEARAVREPRFGREHRAIPQPRIGREPRATRGLRATDRPLRILVAEDNPVNQKVTSALIGRLGHSVTIVGDGRDVIPAIHDETFDLVLLDLRMPGMGGLETASEIVRQFGTNRPPVFALTASATEGDKQRCLDAGMDAFVTKPITLDRLSEVIDQAVAIPQL